MSHFTPTLPIPASPPLPYPCCPPSHPPPPPTLSSLSPSFPFYPSLFWPAPTTNMSLALPTVAPPPNIVLVLDKSWYPGQRYYGGRGRTSPPPPRPLTTLPLPLVIKNTFRSFPATDILPPFGRRPCGGTYQGSSQSWRSWPRSPRQILWLPVPPPYKRSRMSESLPLLSPIPLKSTTIASTP